MTFINELTMYLNLIMICLLFSCVIVGGLFLYFIKVKKISARQENINTNHFKREDTLSYVPLKDVLYKDTLNSDGVLAVTDRCFVAGITVKGYDYLSASTDDKVATAVNATAFFNVVEEKISLRGSVKRIDLTQNIEEYKGVLKSLGIRLAELDAEYQEALKASEGYLDNPEEYKRYANHLKELQRQIGAGNHQVKECKTLIGYMEAMENDSKKLDSGGQKSSQIMFSYVFNPDQYNTELSKEEIYLKAQEALSMKAKAYGDALAACNFKAKRLTCMELLSLIRQSNFPITSDNLSIEELLDSSGASLFLSSRSLEDLQKEKIGEEEYIKQQKMFEQKMAELEEKMKARLEKEKKRIYQESYQKAMEEMKGGSVEL